MYWFGNTSTFVDITAFPSLWNGAALEISGAGDYTTTFTAWYPVVNGPMLRLSASKTVATMSWKLHGFHFDACSSQYGLSINDETSAQPRVEHNNLHLWDVSFYNHLENNTCHGQAFPTHVPHNARGAVYIAHVWSSAIDIGLATVATGCSTEFFNQTAGVVLNEVQYSTLSLRGTGTHSDASFSGPEPWNAAYYPGWGIKLVANVNSNTVREFHLGCIRICLALFMFSCTQARLYPHWQVVQTHCEGSGGCVLIDGPGNFENQFTTAVMSMMQRVLIASHSPAVQPESVPNYNVFHSIVANRYPVKNPTTGAVGRFSDKTEGDPTTLVVKHMSVIG